MLQIHPTAADVAEAAAAEIGRAIADAGALTIGLAGGSTPSATYARLAAGDHEWGKVTLWLGDERWVPPDHPDANTGMVRRTLGPAADRLLAPDTTGDDPDRAAGAYAAELAGRFAAADGRGLPDLVLLGMGDDGHTASLFPGTTALDEMHRDYVATWVEAKQTWRLTATLPLLWSARRVFFLVTGEAKAEMVARILDGDEPFPAQRVAAAASDVTWFLDAAAASRLLRRGGPDPRPR